MTIQITWKRCLTYESAANYTGVIYLHEWHGRQFYWGKADRSYFGGNSRKNKNGVKVAARYNTGYRHWIEGCLQHGGKLYIACIDNKFAICVDEVENILIKKYPTTLNKKFKNNKFTIEIVHGGDIPECITYS